MRHAFRIPQSEFRIRADAYGQVLVLHGADDADGAVTEWEEDTGGSDWDNRVLFAGYRFDAETGLYHVRHRMYHATLGRWIQRDPIGYAGGPCLYAYVGSQPLSTQDPSGLIDPDIAMPSYKSPRQQLEEDLAFEDRQKRLRLKDAVGLAITGLAPAGYDYVAAFGVDKFVEKLQSISDRISYGEKDFTGTKTASFARWGDTVFLKRGEASRGQTIRLIDNSTHEMIHAYDHLKGLTSSREAAEALAYTGTHLVSSLNAARILEDLIAGRSEPAKPEFLCKRIKDQWASLWANLQDYSAVAIRWKEWGFEKGPRAPTDHDVEQVGKLLGLEIRSSHIIDTYNKRLKERGITEENDPSRCCTLTQPKNLKSPFR
ncbi:MAG: RHS repeat-associated core domain-containing protein [Phycisphaerae bacterium]